MNAEQALNVLGAQISAFVMENPNCTTREVTERLGLETPCDRSRGTSNSKRMVTHHMLCWMEFKGRIVGTKGQKPNTWRSA